MKIDKLEKVLLLLATTVVAKAVSEASGWKVITRGEKWGESHEDLAHQDWPAIQISNSESKVKMDLVVDLLPTKNKNEIAVITTCDVTGEVWEETMKMPPQEVADKMKVKKVCDKLLSLIFTGINHVIEE